MDYSMFGIENCYDRFNEITNQWESQARLYKHEGRIVRGFDENVVYSIRNARQCIVCHVKLQADHNQ